MKFVTIFFVLLFAISSFAQEKSKKNIKEGNWLLSGGLSFDKSIPNYDSWSVFLGPSYFIKDNLAVGFEGQFRSSIGKCSNCSSTDNYSFGPAIRYFFYELVDSALFLDQSILHQYRFNRWPSNIIGSPNGARNGLVGTSSVGWVTFLSPSIAFGPKLQYYYPLGKSDLSRFEYWSLSAFFSIYL